MHVIDINARNEILTAKLLQLSYRYFIKILSPIRANSLGITIRCFSRVLISDLIVLLRDLFVYCDDSLIG